MQLFPLISKHSLHRAPETLGFVGSILYVPLQVIRASLEPNFRHFFWLFLENRNYKKSVPETIYVTN